MAGDIRFDGKLVFVGERRWHAPYPISDLRRVGDVVVLLYDPMSGPRHHQFQNLEGFSLDGRRLWSAQHPTTETADCYINFLDGDGLVAWNSACYECALDPGSGRLLSAVFTK